MFSYYAKVQLLSFMFFSYVFVIVFFGVFPWQKIKFSARKIGNFYVLSNLILNFGFV